MCGLGRPGGGDCGTTRKVHEQLRGWEIGNRVQDLSCLSIVCREWENRDPCDDRVRLKRVDVGGELTDASQRGRRDVCHLGNKFERSTSQVLIFFEAQKKLIN